MGSRDDSMQVSLLTGRLEELTRACALLVADLAALRAMAFAGDSAAPAPTSTAQVADGARPSVATVGTGSVVAEGVLPSLTIVAGGEGTAALTVEGMEEAVGLCVQTDRGPGLRIESAGGGAQIESRAGPALYAEARDATAVVASSVGGHGVHAVGGGVAGGMGASSHPCGVFAEGGSGDGLYATGAEVAVRGVSADGYGAVLSGGRAPLRLLPAAMVGPPTSGAHLAGTLFLDATVVLWLCREAGTPGTWTRIVTQ